MGCHTLFYKPYKISLEEAKMLLLEQYKQDITHYSDESTDDTIIETRKALQRGIILLENNLLPEEDVWEDLCKLPNGQYAHYVKGKGMFAEADYHDVFRVRNYPKDELFSYEQTIEFINNRLADDENSLYFDDDKGTVYFADNLNNNIRNDKKYALKRLKEFWEEYPNGMICFG